MGNEFPGSRELVMFYREIIRPRRWEIASEGQGLSTKGDGKTSAQEFQNTTFSQDESQEGNGLE